MANDQMYSAGGEPLRCHHCKYHRFDAGGAQPKPAAFLKRWYGITLGEKAGFVYVCNRCGFMHWFAEPIDELYSELYSSSDLDEE